MMSSPEPMTLGSPTQSPSSHVNQYLPQFLLGDFPSQNNTPQYTNPHHQLQNHSSLYQQQNPYDIHHHSRAAHGSSSVYGSANSNRENNLSYLGGNYGSSSKYSPGYDHHRPSNDRHHSHHNQQNASTVPPGAPPVNRLADVINKPAVSNHSITQNTIYNTPNESRIRAPSFANTTDYFDATQRQSAADLTFTPGGHHQYLTQPILMNRTSMSPPPVPPVLDSFYTTTLCDTTNRVEDKLTLDPTQNQPNDTWITVFGFPPSSTSFVLQEFATYGQILRHVICSQGNWMHIQYQTRLQAQKALSKNGKVLGDSVMVGVMKCIDTTVMNSTPASESTSGSNLTQNANGSEATASFVTSLTASNKSNRVPNLASRFNTHANGIKLDRSQSLRTAVRPLGQFNRNMDQTEVN
jgi:hypothetical protein